VHEFPTLLDSSSISSHGWTQIATTLSANYALYDGFVILHGTDSLAYTASALSFMLSHLGKPIILTGSQASIFALQSDAVDNLLGSLIIAGTFAIPEVGLFFHHTLFRGNRCTKVSASSFDAFASPNCDALARVTSAGVSVNWPVVRRPRSISRFEVQTVLHTGHVACMRVFPGIQPAMLDSVLRLPGLRGLILETFGAGNAPAGEDGSMTNVIRDAVGRGVVIVNVSQCLSGTVSPTYAPATILGRAGVVFGHDLTTEAALTKLSFLLAVEKPKRLEMKEICVQMGRSLRGEITEPQPKNTFRHPELSAEELLPSEKQMAFTALADAIINGSIDAVRSILGVSSASASPSSPPGSASGRTSPTSPSGSPSGTQNLDPRNLLSHADYLGNTALHLAAIGPSEEVLRELLLRGANVHARNRARNTPLGLAERVGFGKHVRVLREAGAVLWVEEEEIVKRET
jgi:lysophospholipase